MHATITRLSADLPISCDFFSYSIQLFSQEYTCRQFSTGDTKNVVFEGLTPNFQYDVKVCNNDHGHASGCATRWPCEIHRVRAPKVGGKLTYLACIIIHVYISYRQFILEWYFTENSRLIVNYLQEMQVIYAPISFPYRVLKIPLDRLTVTAVMCNVKTEIASTMFHIFLQYCTV